jgi:hypothetical protein
MMHLPQAAGSGNPAGLRVIKAAMQDQIIDAAMALALQIDATRARPIAGWIVMRDPPEYPARFAARLVTDHATPYVLVAGNLADLQAQMPAGLVRAERRSAAVPDMVEAWFAHSRIDAGSCLPMDWRGVKIARPCPRSWSIAPLC